MAIARWAGLAAVAGWFAALLWWEHRRPLRAVRESKLSRDVRNLAVAITASPVLQLLDAPVAFWLAQQAERRHLGLVQAFSNFAPMPVLRACAAVLLLDYTLYLWHVMTHRVPFLWRFHQVHHIDREMDATTALRFHFGEMAVSVPFRAAQVFVIGPGPAAVAAWQGFLFLSILFHHSNVRLPLAWERRLARLVMTPRLHGIHHSVVPDEVNSNWSSGLTLWDWMHGTLRTAARQDEIVIGVPRLRSDRDVRFRNLLTLPFRKRPQIPEAPDTPVRQPVRLLM